METIKKNVKAIVSTAIVALILLVGFVPNEISVEVPPPVEEPEPTLSHAQEVWTYALEWCESRGIPRAINPEDLDGTPSYSSWQFKPSTLWYFAEKYGIQVPETDEEKEIALMSREYQFSVLKQMVLHKEQIRWDRQFPWCVKKLGPPPA